MDSSSNLTDRLVLHRRQSLLSPCSEDSLLFMSPSFLMCFPLCYVAFVIVSIHEGNSAETRVSTRKQTEGGCWNGWNRKLSVRRKSSQSAPSGSSGVVSTAEEDTLRRSAEERKVDQVVFPSAGRWR